MFVKTIVLTTAVAGLMFTSQARASDWVAVATACVPDESSAGKYEFEFGRFGFLGNNTGEIALRCNVTSPEDLGSPGWDRLEITYDDPDGFFSVSQVKVTLRRVDKFTGVSFELASFDSNGFVNGQQLKTIVINHNFNFANSGYYVGISAKRTNTTKAPKVQRVRLFVAPAG
jgi:hypothetical protein